MVVSEDRPKEMDFDILHEDWTRFQIKTDNAMLRVRITVAKILETGPGELDIPNFAIAAQNYLSVLVPPELLKSCGEAPELSHPISADDIKGGTVMDFELFGELKWQEYKTSDNWIVMVRPDLGRVIRLKYYSRIGQSQLMEPMYWANVQTVFRVKKA